VPQGTTDVTPYIAMGDALDFRASIGGEDAITAYLHRLARDGGAMLSNAWGTRVLEEEGAACAMANIELPPCTNGSMVSPAMKPKPQTINPKLLPCTNGSMVSPSCPTISIICFALCATSFALRFGTCFFKVAAIPWALMDGYGTWVPTYEMGGGWWTRVSAQV
jgi:hypothetical protein